MCATSVVAQFGRDPTPLRAVARAGPCQSVGNFVQQHLVHIVVAFALGEVSRKRDAALRMIALTKACLCVVKPKRPSLTLEVHPQECVCPDGDALKVGHGHRVEGPSRRAAKNSTLS